jgi:hypothetical protein
MTKLLLALILGLALAATAVMTAYEWNALGDTPMDASGYVALGLGVVAALGVGSGLMWLVFYSSRRGYDDPADIDEPGNARSSKS